VFLSRIELNLLSFKTHKLLASPQVMHASVEGCFIRPDNGKKSRTLWRIDTLRGRTYLIILSTERPDFTVFAEQFCVDGVEGETKDYSAVLNHIATGNCYRFRLVGNPTKKVTPKGAKNGKVVAIFNAEQQLKWFMEKADKSGFKVVANSVKVGPTDWQRFYRKAKDTQVEFGQVVFEGVLEVTDTEEFIDALTSGIGRAKAYGCGLLTIIPR